MAEETEALLGAGDGGNEIGSGGADGGDDDEAALSGCGASPLCNPRRTPHRFVVLVFMCFLGFGSYFCYDNPAALQTQVMQDMKVNTASFMQLYAWYSWPNVILCFFGGFLIDRVFGVRLGTIIFGLFVFIGQIIVAVGAFTNAYWLMELGRFVFGIGGESLAVAQNTYAVNWFKGKELNLVFGLQLSMARLGSTVNMNVMGILYNKVAQTYGSGHSCLGISLMIASFTCLFSLVCALILGFLDKRAEKILHKEQGKTGEVVRLTDVKDFPASLWMVFMVCVGYYVAVFPFIGLGKVFFEEKFGFSAPSAGAVNSIVYVISAPASPVLGFMVDRVGKNILWVLMAVLATLGAHLMLAFTFWNPWIPMSLMGVAYSLLACALWPMVSFLVPEHQLGTAYGFMQSIQNLGLAVIAIAAGSILDSSGYLFLELFFCICLCFALIATVLLYLIDLIRDGGLNLSSRERDKKRELEAAEARRAELRRRESQRDLTRLGPRSAFALRNRYLCRLGAQLPAHYSLQLSSLACRSVLK